MGSRQWGPSLGCLTRWEEEEEEDDDDDDEEEEEEQDEAEEEEERRARMWRRGCRRGSLVWNMCAAREEEEDQEAVKLFSLRVSPPAHPKTVARRVDPIRDV